MSLRKQLRESLRQKSKDQDFWVNLLLFASLGIIFWPFTQWLAHSAHEQSRILNAFIILAFAVFSLVLFNRVAVKDPLTLNPHARNGLILAYLCLLSIFFLSRLTEPSLFRNLALSILSVTAYCSALSAFVLFIFGIQLRRITYTACGTFGVFIFLSTFMGALDWPLRTLAGKWSGSLLGFLGKSVELGISESPEIAPRLILLVDQQPFHVASECNGFGVILTSLLLGIMLALYQRLAPLELLVNVITALFIGITFNILRIVIIVLLAPNMMGYYDLMHEVVGTLSFWTCLLSIWIFLGGPTRSLENSDLKA